MTPTRRSFLGAALATGIGAGAARLAALRAAPEPAVAAKLKPLIDAHQGVVAVSLRHAPSGETWDFQGDRVMPTASLIKFPILVEAYAQAAEGRVRFDQKLTLTKEDMVPGSGILTDNLSPGATFTLEDACRLMIVFSDNTATNMVLDVVKVQAVNARMDRLGLPETRVNAKVWRGSTTSIDKVRTKRYGLGSTTANEMRTLLGLLHARTLVSKEASEAMLAVMRRCDDDEKFPRFLPEGVQVAHKTGSVSAARTSAGIIEFPKGQVLLTVLTDENADQSWKADNAGNRLCAEVARVVHGHYAG